MAYSSPSMQVITTQGLIVVNCDNDPNIVTTRNMTASAAPSDSTVIGSGAIDATRLQVEEGEILLTMNDMLPLGGRSQAGRRAVVFSSLNGLYVPNGISQDAFERQFTFMGMAHTTTFPEGDPGGMGNGISCKRAGSGTTYNNSTVTFSPGDVIGFRLPSVDKTARDREVPTTSNSRVATERYRQDKHVAILTKVTYEDITSQFDLAVQQLLDNVGGISVPDYERSMSSGQDPYLGSVEELAVLLKKSMGWFFLSAVRTAAKSGIVQWSQPGTDAQQLEMLGNMLGLIESQPSLESVEMQRSYLRWALNGSMSMTNQASQEKAAKIIEKIQGFAQQTGPQFAQSGSRTTVADQLAYIALSSSSDLVRAYGKCMNNFERNTIGTASCFSAPGTGLDYILRS